MSVPIIHIFYRLKLAVSGVVLVTILMFIVSLPLRAQQAWSLTRCIDYAVDNNIDLSITHNSVETQQINLQESKTALFPDLNLGSQVNMNFGRNIDPNTNDVTFNRTMQNYYWINSSVDVFRGLVKINTIRFNNYLLAANREEALFEKNQLVFKILTAYYTVLYSSGLVKVARNQAELSEKQINRMEKFVEVGRESAITVQELESQHASDNLSLTRAENLYNKTLLELKQLLRLGNETLFEIDTTEQLPISLKPVPDVDSLYKEAVATLPQIRQQQLLYQASVKDLAVAKGFISPRLYITGGYSTNFFDGAEMTYIKQLENNQNQWINMSISIPVFNNAAVHSRIKRKRIAVSNQQLKLEKERETLYTEIWKAVDALRSAENEYLSAVELKHFSQLSLKNIITKMEKGLAGTTDYDVAKQRYTSAQATLLKAKLIYIMRMQMLEFYRKGNWEHLYR
jgi:outer membrane protein